MISLTCCGANGADAIQVELQLTALWSVSVAIGPTTRTSGSCRCLVALTDLVASATKSPFSTRSTASMVSSRVNVVTLSPSAISLTMAKSTNAAADGARHGRHAVTCLHGQYAARATRYVMERDHTLYNKDGHIVDAVGNRRHDIISHEQEALHSELEAIDIQKVYAVLSMLNNCLNLNVFLVECR